MILIIGGAYQGKLEYARKELAAEDGDVFDCRENSGSSWPWLDKDKKVWNHFQYFVLDCVREGVEALEYLKANPGIYEDKIILADDITQGVVPVDPLERAWREETGRCLVFLGQKADRVVRIFCGLPQDLK